MDMAKYMESRSSLNHRLPEFRASLVELRSWRSVKNAKRWAEVQFEIWWQVSLANFQYGRSFQIQRNVHSA
jgi:hypothetical protein